MAGTSLSRLVSQTGTKTFAPTPVSEKKQASSEACLEMLDFRSPWQRPHFLVLSPRLGRKHLPPHPFLKKTRQAVRLVWKCWIFVAHGRDLTLLFCGQVRAGTFVPAHISEKTTADAEAHWPHLDFYRSGRCHLFPVWLPMHVEN